MSQHAIAAFGIPCPVSHRALCELAVTRALNIAPTAASSGGRSIVWITTQFSLSLSLHSPVRDVWVLVSQTTLHTSPDATVGSSARCVSLVPVSRVLQVSALASVCHATRHPPPPPSQRPPHPNMSLLHPSIRESCAFLPSAPATLSHLLHHTRAHSPSAPILKPLTNPAPPLLSEMPPQWSASIPHKLPRPHPVAARRAQRSD